jgi:hypothetical protein
MEIKDKTKNILESFSKSLLSKKDTKDKFSIYYKNGGSLIDIFTVIQNEEDEKLLNKIFKSEAKVLNDFIIKNNSKDLNINFRVIPLDYGSVKSLVPSNFKKYVH